MRHASLFSGIGGPDVVSVIICGIHDHLLLQLMLDK